MEFRQNRSKSHRANRTSHDWSRKPYPYHGMAWAGRVEYFIIWWGWGEGMEDCCLCAEWWWDQSTRRKSVQHTQNRINVAGWLRLILYTMSSSQHFSKQHILDLFTSSLFLLIFLCWILRIGKNISQICAYFEMNGKYSANKILSVLSGVSGMV